MITAEEFFDDNHGLYIAYSVKNKDGKFVSVVSIDKAIEFAKLHVKAALEAAAENAAAYSIGACIIIDKESILNAYPEDLIK